MKNKTENTVPAPSDDVEPILLLNTSRFSHLTVYREYSRHAETKKPWLAWVRTDAYSSDLEYFNWLLSHIPAMVPRDSIWVVHFGGPRIKRTFGLEFHLSADSDVTGWTETTAPPLL